jgi:hypothetical protein
MKTLQLTALYVGGAIWHNNVLPTKGQEIITTPNEEMA